MRALLFSTSPEITTPHEFSITLLRVFSGLTMALAHGLGKVPPPDQLIQGVGAMGFPMPVFFAWLAGLSELLCGILLAIGLLTRPAAFFLSITMLVAAFIAHGSDPFSVREHSLLYLVIFLFFFMRGSGRWSVDHTISRGN
ncbi:MAG TPA: DoxX family protein [Bacteriovoracaceae bacterium]|nr:DoxX family protein [Bacteriovoracaceae bacterium]